MIDRLNYTTHAIENIRQQQRELANKGIPPEPNVYWVLDILDTAVKFILPDHGELLDLTSFDQKHADLIKLPYPITVIEAPFPPRPEDRLASGKETSSRRIGLYVEMTAAQMLKKFPGAERPEPHSEGVLVIAIYYVDAAKRWEISGCASYFPYEQEAYNRLSEPNTPASLNYLAEVQEEGRPMSKMALRCYLAPLQPMLLHSMRQAGFDDDRIKAAMIGNISDEQIMLAQLCAVLNCGNVEQADVPVPEKLARARAKSGKLPLYDYRVLTVSGDVASREQSDKPGYESAMRRTHLRRGHIRRLAAGRLVWVRPALVNADKDAGIIEKSYRVKSS
ncbi:hypothetical protein GG804_22340 [Sphingomonas histidinilytica]|uniref:hypothetical protein n=1 Tax=Rhizorhabdus histidinilytica TaxID=439228 RepID=UPI001ADA52C8|nr:hypothetical protein [Rhizorhabdus histidinilytica]MBO9379516.1 hypothetical protein [Rhizorhabdus histidinilytica]